jgi:hypothetical protein
MTCSSIDIDQPCTRNIANRNTDPINVRFGPIGGLRFDITRGPKNAKLGHSGYHRTHVERDPRGRVPF